MYGEINQAILLSFLQSCTCIMYEVDSQKCSRCGTCAILCFIQSLSGQHKIGLILFDRSDFLCLILISIFIKGMFATLKSFKARLEMVQVSTRFNKILYVIDYDYINLYDKRRDFFSYLGEKVFHCTNCFIIKHRVIVQI